MNRRSLPHDEVTLSAYIDGALEPAAVIEVEAWLAQDSEARRLLDELRAVDRRVGRALDPVLDERMPDALRRRIEAAAAGRRLAPAKAGGAPGRPGWMRGWLQGWTAWALAAALLLLVLGLPAAWQLAAERGRDAERQAAAAAAAREARAAGALEAALQKALETTVSGDSLPWLAEEGGGSVRPVRTYKSTGGQWCREYRIEAAAAGVERAERGIACRVVPADGGTARWERKVLFLDEMPLPATGDDPA